MTTGIVAATYSGMDDDVPNDALREAIRNMHGCDSTFVEAVDVREEHDRRVVWEGAVKVFDLIGHPKASRAYAWSYPTTGGKRRFVAVLRLPPVDSPAIAVRASILADERAKQK
jgi:hypothetical protein